MTTRLPVILATILAGAVLAGCKGIPTRAERQARDDLQQVANGYRPEGRKPGLLALDTNVTLSNLLTFAMLNEPRVEAAYFDYVAAVERITTERSLPDPRLTLELDVQDVVMTVMPGLMAEIPWVKKLRIRADEASSESQAKYFAFEKAVLQAAFDVKRPYYQLHFLNDRIRIGEETLQLLGVMEQNALAQTESGKVTLQDVLRTQLEQERMRTEIENLKDSRNPLLAQLKAALGLAADQPAPPVPQTFESTPMDIASDKFFALALERNPGLRQMEAEVRMAETEIRLSHTSRLPDFNFGVEADMKASPTLWRPSLGTTLPIWRDKIAAEIASAQARKSAAKARLNAEQIQLAVEFADKTFMYREATRDLSLLSNSLLPRAQQSLDVARLSYSSGKTDFLNLLDAQRSFLEFQLAEIEARTRRELVLAEVSLLIAGIPPTGAPLLPQAISTRSPAESR